ncbi:voltage-dependent anion channel-domain-containing protein [Coniochaeta sp. 2T2.1]|nr:voltage-dependent anion channel-domain-containing protein [Coniochaeta sp. 2T2.1]
MTEREGVDPLKRYDEEEAVGRTTRRHGAGLLEEEGVEPGGRLSVVRENTGYESPDEQHQFVREPHQIRGCPATVPHRRHHNAREQVLEGQEPEHHSHASLNDLVLGARKVKNVGIRDRVACVQWTWFTMTMATGGIANVLASIPFQAQWLTIIGLIFFFLNIVLFIMNCILTTLRFRFRPNTFNSSFTDQVESLFTAAVIVSIATIFITICEYGVPHTGPWLLQVMEVLFWVYVGVSMVVSASIYLILWSTLTFPVHTMTPIWVFPAYPLLLTAPFGQALIGTAIETSRLSSLNTVAIAFASISVQGAGFLISLMISTAFLYRLMTQKLPRDAQRPGIFVSIGPFAFTVAGVVGLGDHAEEIIPLDFLGNAHAVFILKVLSYMLGLWLWGLAVWFFLVSAGSLWKYLKPDHRLPFQMTWFSFVFPNTALVTATLALGKAFESHALQVTGCVLAGCLVVVWLFVFGYMLRALWRRELLWPRDED